MKIAEIKNILENYEGVITNESELFDIGWKLEESSAESIIFYNLKDDQESEKIFLEKASKYKYGLLIVNRKFSEISNLINCIIIDKCDFNKIQKNFLEVIYPIDWNNKTIIGITGTNGKTTTGYLLLQILKQNNIRSCFLGTLGLTDSDLKVIKNFNLTTPPLIDLHKVIYNVFKLCNVFIMEVSSHAIDQERIFGLKYDAGCWTSFSQDHLDYHSSLEEYFQVKFKLPSSLMKKNASFFYPKDDEYLERRIGDIAKPSPPVTKLLGVEKNNFFKARYNLSNLSLALSLAKNITKTENIILDVETLLPPPGRYTIFKYNSNFVIIDFAHTPDALENILNSVRKDYKDYKIKTLFGCGGNRDKSKRPKMGEIAEKFSDYIYLTSDNPRFEMANEILNEIKIGFKTKNYYVHEDRKETLNKALCELKEKEVLIIAGKGHEDYQEIKGVKYPYSDIDVVKKFLLTKS